MVESPQQTNPVGGQQGMARQISVPQQTAVTNPNLKPGPAQNQDQIDGKKSKKWIWIILGILALVGIIVGSYFFIF